MQEQNLSESGKSTYWAIALVVIVLLAGFLWFLTGGKEDEISNGESSEQVLVLPEVETGTLDNTEEGKVDLAEQVPSYEQEAWQFEEEGGVLPELDHSDAEFTRDLLTVSPQMKSFLFKEEQVKKTMFSINDMAQGLRPPVKRLREISFPQPFSVTEEGGRVYMSAQSYHRYDRLAQAINSIDRRGVVALYKKYLPLFQVVFAEFSYPDNYQVLDSIKAATGKIIQAPVITGKIELIRPSVYYKFADLKIEKLSALDKQMLRMGPDNTRLIQNKLRELIEALIAAEQE